MAKIGRAGRYYAERYLVGPHTTDSIRLQPKPSDWKSVLTLAEEKIVAPEITQLERVIHSGPFKTSEIHRALLVYLVEKSLSNTADSLKEYTVGLEVFHKPSSYDPRQESTVRMHVGRLRQKLTAYYRLLAYSVNSRLREFGVRAAVGASPEELVRMIFREAAMLTLPGLFVGILLSLAFARAMKSFVYRMSPADPLSIAAAGLFLVLVTFFSTWLPARKAAAVDLAVALRNESWLRPLGPASKADDKTNRSPYCSNFCNGGIFGMLGILGILGGVGGMGASAGKSGVFGGLTSGVFGTNGASSPVDFRMVTSPRSTRMLTAGPPLDPRIVPPLAE